MRIATNHYQNRAVNSILETQSTLANLQEQASTGMRVNRASDDPIAAAEAERLRSAQARFDIEKRMMSYAKAQMSQAESLLGSGIDTLQEARDLLIGAQNGTYSASEHKVQAGQLAAFRNQLLTLANSVNSEHEAVFGGQGGEGTPFAPSGNPTFGALPGTRQNGLDSDYDLTVNGARVFQGFGADGKESIFQQLDKAEQALNSGDRELINTTLNEVMGAVDQTLDRMSIGRSSLGEQMRVIEVRERLVSSGEMALGQRRSDLVDADYASVISGIQSRELALRAAMQTYSQISQLSMFNYL